MKNSLFGIPAVFILCLSGCGHLREAGLLPFPTYSVTTPVIIVDPESPALVKEAAAELKSYLELQLQHSVSLQGKPAANADAVNIFLSVSPPSSSGKKLVKAGYRIGRAGIFLHAPPLSITTGRSDSSRPDLRDVVYAFLENECGIHWVFPGEDGVAVPVRDHLEFREGVVFTMNSLPHMEVRYATDQTESSVHSWLRHNRVVADSLLPIDLPYAGFAACGLPTGLEEQVYRDIHTALSKGGRLPGITIGPGLLNAAQAYTVAQAAAAPRLSRAEIERRFCSVFGDASEAVGDYLAAWRQQAAEYLIPHMADIVRTGGGNPYRGALLDAGKIFPTSVFSSSGAILDRGLLQVKGDREKRFIERLAVDHEQALLTVIACTSDTREKSGTAEIPVMIPEPAIHLRDLRRESSESYIPYAPELTRLEGLAGDLTWIHFLNAVEGLKPAAQLPLIWYTGDSRIDPGTLTINTLRETNPANLRTDEPWFRTLPANTGNTLRWIALIYDVDALLRQQDLYLGFRGVDADLTLLVNGRICGQRQRDPNGISSFVMRIDKQFLTDPDEQLFVICLNNDREQMGIWHPVWLLTAKVPEKGSN